MRTARRGPGCAKRRRNARDCPLDLSGEPGEFTIAGNDRRFFPAEMRIEGNAIRLWSAHVAEPVAARYAWRNAPEAAVFNDADLPLAPFRTDDWPEAREEPR